MDELRSIRIFAKAVELGSFRAAAKEFGLSPSVVSYHISQLEQRYDIALLYRSTRKLSLTAEGKQLYEHAQAVARAAADCLNLLARESTSPAGKLVVSMPAVLIDSDLLIKVAEFSKTYPKINIDINYTDTRQDLIADGIDVAIRVGAMQDSSLKAKLVSKVNRKLVCAPEYYNLKDQPKSPLDLADWNWINMSMLPASRSFVNKKGKTIKTENVSNISVNSVNASHKFSLYGLGLSSPPDFMVNAQIESGDLVHVLPNWEMTHLDVFAVWPGNVKRRSMVNLFVSSLADENNQK